MLQLALQQTREIFQAMLNDKLSQLQLQFLMNIQKINIKLPEKPDVSGLLASKPCQPLPHPQLFNQIPHQRNYYPSPNSKPFHYFNASQNKNLPIDIQGKPFQTTYYHNRSSAHGQMGNSIMPIVPPQRDINPHSLLASSLAGSVQQGKRSESRPKSPKIQFKYVSPVKDNQKLSSIIERSNESQVKNNECSSMKKKNLVNKVEAREKQKISKDSRDLQNNKELIKRQKAERNQIEKKKSVINNNVYLVESLNEDSSLHVKNSLEDSSSLKLSNNIDAHTYEKQQITPSNKNGLRNEGNNRYAEANSDRLKYVEGYFIYDSSQNAVDKYDEEMRKMQEQYEKLKKLNNSEDENFLPRIESNSSENQYTYEFDSKQSSHVVHKNIQYKGTFGNVDELISSEVPLRDREKEKKFSSQIVREDLIISGIQSIKSEVMEYPKKNAQKSEAKSEKKEKQRVIDKSEEYADNDIKLESRDEGSMENEKESEYRLKIKQREVEIKNLKNQVWLMRIRQKQLLSTIQRLQQINKDQNVLIDKLSKNK